MKPDSCSVQLAFAIIFIPKNGYIQHFFNKRYIFYIYSVKRIDKLINTKHWLPLNDFINLSSVNDYIQLTSTSWEI